MKNPSLRLVAVALTMLVAFLVQGTWALAGTTGGLSGVVTDEKGAPVVAATVTVSAPSGTSTTTTDASGHFVFLNLAPDTYTVSMKKDGYNPVSQGGVTVFADQTHVVNMQTEHAIREIGHVTSRAANDLVKSGTTADIYSVNAATAEKVATIGGGTNLNSAYSALASQPGVMLDYGGMGWGQTIYIHGASYSQVGYEFDGIPVNRAFDNYNANTLTNLGQQELQVYTGGAPSSSTSATVGGFINQVIRTGTYPGFGNVNAQFAAPSYYHALQGEAGGATPNRLFSYYVGLLGYDQSQRIADQFDGGLTPGLNISPSISTGPNDSFQTGGVFSLCNVPGTPYPPATSQPGGCIGALPFGIGTAALIQDRESVANFHIGIPHRKDSGRDDVQLLYSGSFQHELASTSINDYGGYAGYCQNFYGASSCPTPASATFIPYADATFFNNNASIGQVLTPGQTIPLVNYYFPNSPTNRALNSQLPYDGRGRGGQSNDSQIVKVQYTHNIGSNAYLRLYGYTFYSDWLLNDPTFAEVQYFLNGGFTPFSNDYELQTHTKGGAIEYANQINAQHLLQADINYVTAGVSRYNNSSFRAGTINQPGSAGAGCYQCGTNLIMGGVLNPTGCVNFETGAPGSCFSSTTQAPFWDPTQATEPPIPGASWVVTNLGPSGTLNKVTPKFGSFSVSDQWRPNDKLLINIGLRGDQFVYNLTPTSDPSYQFWFAAGAASFCYDPANANFAALQFAKAGGAPVPGTSNLVLTAPGSLCPNSPITGQPMLHPNGSTAPGSGNPAGTNPLLFTNTTQPSYTVGRLEPRLSGTYTQSPDTVWRFSAGQYVNPFNTATVEYVDASPKRAAYFDFQSFFGLGFTTPEHQVQPTTSTNYDLSLERRIRGTDTSFKISPFYRDVHNQTQDSFIGPGFVSALPTNNERAWGVELQINKGDPNKNGLSGQLSYTWTRADSKFNPIGSTGQNFIDGINGAVGAYNALTHAGSGTSYTLSTGQRITLQTAAPCYFNGQGFGTGFAPITTSFGTLGPADCVVSGNSILMSPLALGGGAGMSAVQNPYYFAAPQGYYDPAGRYPLYQTFPNIYEAFPDLNMTIVWPQIISGFINYKHDRFSIAPNFQLIQGYSGGSNGGAYYGSPLSVTGLDPRGCLNNQSSIPGSNTPQMPAYPFVLPNGNIGCGASNFGSGFLYVPDPYTGTFDGFGKYQNPWLFNLNMQLSYDITPKVKASLLLANIYNRCFGGTSTPWSSFSPPGSVVCGYDSNFGSTYAGAPGLTPPGTGYFIGNSPTNPVNGNVWSQAATFYPYQPQTSFLPFTAYLTLQFKI